MEQLTLKEKLSNLTNEELFQLIKELRSPAVADDALIRQVIKGTEQDTTATMIAFIAVQGLLSFEFALRLKHSLEVIKMLEAIVDISDRHPSNL